MGDPNPASRRDEFGAIVRELNTIRMQIDELKKPSGTQRYRVVEELSELVSNIQGKLEEYNASRYTNAQVNSLVDQKVAAAISAAFAGNVSITGSLTVNGALAAASLSTGGALTAGGQVKFPGARGTSLSGSSGRVAAWMDAAGILGQTA